VGSEGLWTRFAALVGIDAEEPRFARNGDRVAHRDELIAVVEEHFSTEPAEHWLGLLLEAGIPAGKVRSIDDVYSWEQVLSQGLVLDVDHPAYGALRLSGSPLRFDENAYSGGRASHVAPPTLGQHSEAIRAWLSQSPGGT
jgi:crotonobetainyl-CoA:carnitine CoA-transferase CaiB-like acyl-CoA transferase